LSLDVAEQRGGKLSFRQSGVLFFAKQPQRFLKESMVTCVRYQGADRFNIIDRAEILGDPITMIEAALQFVKRNMNVAYEINGQAQHKERYTYPPAAVREAIINAIMHRDYFYDGSHVYVHVFSDRMEIENPGGLLPGLTLNDLGKRSVRRNRTIADLLYRARFVERIGSGIQRMERELSENGNPPMEISVTNFFVLRFLPRVETNTAPLTARQNRLYQFAVQRPQITKAEAAEHLAVSGDTALREIKVLIAHGLLSQTGTGKGTRYSVV
jgi:ATP-dependent DNA helicase RecG